jgi:hypothetical protein
MATNGDKEFIKEIFSDINMRKTIEDIVEIWNNRLNIMGELFLDYFIEKHHFKNINDVYGKMLNEDIFIFSNVNKLEFEFGFGSVSGNMSKNIQKGLKMILEKNADFINFREANGAWVYGNINKDIFDRDDIESMYRVLTLKLEEYKKLAFKLL